MTLDRFRDGTARLSQVSQLSMSPNEGQTVSKGDCVKFETDMKDHLL